MSRKKQTKDAAELKEVQVRKDYAATETSPYSTWRSNKGDIKQEHDAKEPAEANPDMLDESTGLYYQKECNDERLDLIERVIPTLTDKQKEILRMCGNEGRTIENCAAILKISRGSVQKTLERIRQKVRVLQNEGL